MAELKSWPSIQKHGLLSTTALLDLYNIHGKKRFTIESCIRPSSVDIYNKRYGKAVIRDQKPLSEKKLLDLLVNITPRQFYRLLNGKVFFWVRKKKLETLLNARAYRDKAHDVLTVDTEKLVKKYKDKVTLSKINSGATYYKRGIRGRQTFQSIDDYPFQEYKKKRRENAIVELAIDYGVVDIKKYVIRVDKCDRSKRIKKIW